MEQKQSLVFLGFLAKMRFGTDPWNIGKPFQMIASMSGCLAEEAPKDYSANGWQWNFSGCYKSEGGAWQVVPEEEAESYDLFAYFIYPTYFDGAGEHAFDVVRRCPDLPESPDLSDYQRLGIDIVQETALENGLSFGCSPLSCNGLAAIFSVNPYYLVDAFPEARAIILKAGRSAQEQMEPGRYCMVEIWKKRKEGEADLNSGQ